MEKKIKKKCSTAVLNNAGRLPDYVMVEAREKGLFTRADGENLFGINKDDMENGVRFGLLCSHLIRGRKLYSRATLSRYSNDCMINETRLQSSNRMIAEDTFVNNNKNLHPDVESSVSIMLSRLLTLRQEEIIYRLYYLGESLRDISNALCISATRVAKIRRDALWILRRYVNTGRGSIYSGYFDFIESNSLLDSERNASLVDVQIFPRTY